MGLKKIVEVLLPADYREQVVGDIEERGFRLREIANVLPRVWASYFVRTITAPAPQIPGASDDAIRARTEQLARQGAIALYGLCVALWTLYLPFRRGLPHVSDWPLVAMGAVIALTATPSYFMSLRRALPDSNSFDASRSQLLRRYIQQIDYQLTLAKGLLYAPSVIIVLWMFGWYKSGSVPPFLMFEFPIAVGIAVLAARRVSRLRMELTSLELAQ